MNKIVAVITFAVVTSGCDGTDGPRSPQSAKSVNGKQYSPCEEYGVVNPREAFSWIPEGVEENKREANIPLILAIDEVAKEHLLTVSADSNSETARAWSYIKDAVERARREEPSSGQWARVSTGRGLPEYAYLPRDLGDGYYLSCTAWQDPADQVLLDGTCSLTGRINGAYFVLDMTPEDWEHGRDQILEAIGSLSRCISKHGPELSGTDRTKNRKNWGQTELLPIPRADG